MMAIFLNKGVSIDQERFTDVVDEMLGKIRNTMIVKGEEYMRDNDRLSNFKLSAGIRRKEIPEGALLGMLIKHWASIADIVEDIKEGRIAPLYYSYNVKGENK